MTSESENKSLARRFLEELGNKGVEDRLSEFLAPEYVAHHSGIAGIEQAREHLLTFQHCYPDMVVAVGDGEIYTSTDSGTNWSQQAGSSSLISVASSADGTKLVAAVSQGQIYTSSDSGVTWTAQNSDRAWQSVASSADGSKLVAVEGGGDIYTSVPSSISSTTSGTGGYLLGNPSAAIELQYPGNNQFLPLSHEGLIQAF